MSIYDLSTTVTPTGAPPSLPNYMPGTVSPEDMEKKRKQEAMITALRTVGQGAGAAAPASTGAVTSAGYLGQGMDTSAIGNALGKMF